MGLPGVSIIIKGTVVGTVTNIDGGFSLSGIKSTDTLLISFMGYESQEIVIGKQQIINIFMRVSANELGEVVVTALGIKRQQREIGYSTQKIDVDIVVQSNTPNVLDAIIGRSAGVSVIQGDGVDGGSTRITIRGNNNLTGNNQSFNCGRQCANRKTHQGLQILEGVQTGEIPLEILTLWILKTTPY